MVQSPHPRQALSQSPRAPARAPSLAVHAHHLSSLESALTRLFGSAGNKGLTENLTPLESAHTKNPGGRGTTPALAPLFQNDTRRVPFRLIAAAPVRPRQFLRRRSAESDRETRRSAFRFSSWRGCLPGPRGNPFLRGPFARPSGRGEARRAGHPSSSRAAFPSLLAGAPPVRR